jgi:hypothetical protein
MNAPLREPIIIKARGFTDLFHQLADRAEPGSIMDTMIDIRNRASKIDESCADLIERAEKEQANHEREQLNHT